MMLADGFLPEVKSKGVYLSEGLQRLADRFPDLASGVRGLGLIQGLVLTERGIELGGDIVNRLFDKGIIINFAGNAVLRFVPPLVVTNQQIDRLLEALELEFSERSTV